jgi:hypothetical protein
VRIPSTIEWLGHRAGWQATAEYRGKTITVAHQKSFALARRRLRAALEAAGVPTPDLQITARMPKTIETDLARYKEVAKLIPQLTSELEELKMKLAQRLCTELNFSERDAAIWLGVSGAHISAKLRALTIDTSEFRRPSVDEQRLDDRDNETEPAHSTVKTR